MPFIILIGFAVLVWYDARILYRNNQPLYKKYYSLYPPLWGIMSLLLLLVALPVYLYRRWSFCRELQEIISAQEVLPDGHPAPGGKTEHPLESPSLNKAIPMAGDATGVLLNTGFFSMLASLMIEGAALLLPHPPEELARGILITLIAWGIMIYFIHQVTRKYPQGFWGSVGLRFEHPRLSFFRTVFLPLIVGIVFSAVAAYLISQRDIQPATPLSELVSSTQSLAVVMIFAVIGVLLAPLIEELIFRGYLFGVLRKHKGQTTALIVIATSFAALHVGQYWGDWLAIFMVALLGVALTCLRIYSGTTVASIISHYTYNFCVVLIPIVMMSATNPSYAKYQSEYPLLSAQAKEELLLESIQSNPNFSAAYNDLAWLYAEERVKLDEALRLVEKALYHEPENSAYLDTKAEVLYQLGRYDEAVKIESKLVEKFPDVPVYKEHLRKYQLRSPPLDATDLPLRVEPELDWEFYDSPGIVDL